MSVTVRLLPWSEARDTARAIRYAVFVEEQGVPVELEWDDHDDVCWHAIAYDAAGTPVATGRLLPDGHIGRMAVLARARGIGIGALVLQALMEKGEDLGYPQFVLNAQTHATGFYRRAGFEPVGEPFEEAGIPHLEMRRVVRAG
ncbi:GNAT family N-acetyltransferase [Cupriavidus sp. AU9028]|uniref:GNAT family N-acetyltransferase n=1 Tax=Cupriavidus sp. AU9028 TaxID=2871157 RepID=UPI001C948A08|nr:GNAT family N-acetyltransferase [Cupriavidus sp. AU9028]MBY4897474.1 GNAT family N-acetyltransferase [Cupriavidus sp. AU9028]